MYPSLRHFVCIFIYLYLYECIMQNLFLCTNKINIFLLLYCTSDMFLMNIRIRERNTKCTSSKTPLRVNLMEEKSSMFNRVCSVAILVHILAWKEILITYVTQSQRCSKYTGGHIHFLPILMESLFISAIVGLKGCKFVINLPRKLLQWICFPIMRPESKWRAKWALIMQYKDKYFQQDTHFPMNVTCIFQSALMSN